MTLNFVAFGFLSAIMMVHLLFIPLYHMAVRFVFMIDEKHFLLFHSIADARTFSFPRPKQPQNSSD
jgi:hypothetical protein